MSYNADGVLATTQVSGSSYTGLYAADGSYNIVLNTSSSYVGLYHPCGAWNAVVVTDPSAGYYNINGSLNVISNNFGGYSPVIPLGTALGIVSQNYFTSDGSSWGFEQQATAPSAVYDSNTNRTWQTWEAWDGTSKSIRVAYYDHTSSSWSQTYQVGNVMMQGDDHGLPALCRDSNGYWWCFYGPHNSSMQYARTTNVDDPSSWTPQNVIADLVGNYTYPHPTFINGKIYLFMRYYDSGNNRAALNLRVGTVSSGTITWGADIIVVAWATSRVYQGNHIISPTTPTEIQIIAAQADIGDTIRQDVHIFRYDTTTGNVITWDGLTTVTPASFPITSTSTFRIVDNTAGFVPAWCYDANGQPHIIYMDGPSSSGPFNLNYVTYSGGAWTSPLTLGAFATSGTTNHRFDGYTVVPQTGGGILVLWPKSNSTFGRGSGTISYRTRSSSGVWTAEADFFTATGQLALDAPLMVRDGIAGYRFAIGESTGLATTLPTVPPGSKIYAFSDTGPVKRVPAASRLYLPETETLINRMTVIPSSSRIALYDAFIRGLKSDGIFDQLDAVYFHKCHDRQAARLNVIRNGRDLVETDSANITFVTDSYMQGNGTSSRLSTYDVPNTVQNIPNLLSVGSTMRYNTTTAHVWGVTNNLGDAGVAFGFGDPVNFYTGFANINATQLQSRINKTGTSSVTLGTNGGVGFACVSTSGGTATYDVNGTQGTFANSTLGLPQTGFGVLGQGTTSFSNRQMLASGFGGALTAAQQELLRARVNTYLTAV